MKLFSVISKCRIDRGRIETSLCPRATNRSTSCFSCSPAPLVFRCTSIVSHNANFKISPAGTVEPRRAARNARTSVEAASGDAVGGGGGSSTIDRTQNGEADRAPLLNRNTPSDTPASSPTLHRHSSSKTEEGHNSDNSDKLFRGTDERRMDRGPAFSPNRPACELSVSNRDDVFEERGSPHRESVGSTATRSLRCGTHIGRLRDG